MPDSEASPATSDVAALLTVVVTTSPVLSHPSTCLIDAVLESFAFAAGLAQCPKLIVCDGFKLKTDGTSRRESRKSYRQGVITAEHAPKYEEYKSRLRERAGRLKDTRYVNATIIELQQHHGFGFAVMAALRRVHTPLVMIVQHDRMFVRTVPLKKVVQALHGSMDMNMVSFLTQSTMQHVLRVQSRCRQAANSSTQSTISDAEWQALRQPRWTEGLRLVPMLQWLDSTHIAKVEFYKRVVFQPGQIKRGSFIEDKIGNMMLDDLRLRGVETHCTYATWILDDDSMEPMVRHAHGRAFLTGHLRRERIADSVGKKNLNSFGDINGEGAESGGGIIEWNKHDENSKQTVVAAQAGHELERCSGGVDELRDGIFSLCLS